MQIRITNGNGWYQNYEGAVFTVIGDGSAVMFLGVPNYEVEHHNGTGSGPFYVDQDDCEVVQGG